MLDRWFSFSSPGPLLWTRWKRWPPVRSAVLAGCTTLLLLLAGCATPDSSRDDSGGSSEEETGLSLAQTDESVRTIQVYAGSAERNLPIIRLNGSEQIQLEFDLMTRRGRPLSVYFYHADRTWQRDLSPSQYLESFQDDNLLDYDPSIGTEIDYTHYTYRFPNDDIRFRLSGNYVLRVTEQGRPDEVLFERPFFITENAGAIDFRTEGVVVTGQRQPSIRPVALFRPPSGLQGSPFNFTTCFLRNGRLPDTRCESRPRLTQAPDLSFELERRRAFAPTTADYYLDLTTLRVGGSIERVDRSTSPFSVLLKPDFARFSDSPLEPPLNGQTVVRGGQSQRDPEVTAEYVRTTFAFVPPNEQPLNGEVAVVGSFSNMQYDADNRLAFVADRGRYEGSVLLKEGQYEYFYDSSDPALRQVLRQNLPRATNSYTAFVYYNDASENTDRLLMTRTVER